jgi:hypothetical protein
MDELDKRNEQGPHDEQPGIGGTVKKVLGDSPAMAAGAGVAGAALGAAGGMLAGPLGIIPGAAAGAAAGVALAQGATQGRPAPPHDEAYWREQHAAQPEQVSAANYEDCEPAYRLGFDAATRFPSASSWEEVGDPLQAEWQGVRGRSMLGWPQAEPMARWAWEHTRSHMSAPSQR